MHLSRECQRQILASTPVIFNEFVLGLGYGWIAPTLRQLQDNPNSDLSLSTDEASWIASLHEFSRFCGPLITPPLLNLAGRKGVLGIASIALLGSFALIAFSKSVTILYLARAIFGVAVALHDVTAAIYLCENFKPTFRGAFGSISVVSFYAGSLVEFCLGNYLTYELTAYTNTAIALLGLSAIFVSTETAEYLITKGRYESALKNFLWLRGKKIATADMISEFDTMKVHLDGEHNNMQKSSLKTLLSIPVYRKTIVIVLIFCVLTNATGFDPITAYVSISFTEGVFTPSEYTMLFGMLQLVAAVFGTTFIELVDRRVILMITLSISSLVHAATAALFYFQNQFFIPYFSWWIFVTITIYAMMVSSTVLPIFATVRGELLPQNVRSFGGAIAVIGHSFVGFFTAKVFMLFDVYWNFIFYSVTSMACVIFVYFVLPETRGKSLIEIQNAIAMGRKIDIAKH